MTFIDPDGRWKRKPFAWIVEYLGKRHVKVKPLFSNKEAARALRQNKNVDFARRQDAVAAQRPNSGGGRPEKDPPHPDPVTGSTEGRLPHAHASGRPEGVGHAAWGTAILGFGIGIFSSIFNVDADPANEFPDALMNEQYDQVALWLYGKSYDELTQAEREIIRDTMSGKEPLPSTPHGGSSRDADIPVERR